MLEFRLKLLYPHVDKFIIIEADKTFSGLDKPFNFELHRQRFAWAEDKLRYFKLSCDISGLNLTKKPTQYDPSHDCWKIEYAQRGAILTACGDFEDDDILLMGDVDEIPSLEAIDWTKNNVRKLPVACQQHFFYYDLENLRQEPWCGSIFTTLRTARSLGSQELRNRRNILTRIGNAGWHLSYFGKADSIIQKIEAFSHQELNRPEFKTAKHVVECLSTGEDLFNRPVLTKRVTPDFFPQYIRDIAPTNWWPETGSIPARISLTMIVRNEGQNLPKCLESVRGLCDEIVIVDTGSTDNTKEIALRFGARIVDFTWIDDFSAARNVALSNALGDYAFWLDADDVVDASERTKLEAIFKTLSKGSKQAYVLNCASDRGQSENGGQLVVDHVRIFPIRDNIRWIYKVHEQILPSLSNAGISLVWTDITIRHMGYVDSEAKERKRQRDYNILIKELAQYPNEPFILYNLGMIYFERREWQRALKHFQTSFANVSLPAYESIQCKLYSMIAWSYQILENYAESVNICDEGLKNNPDDAELWFRKAVAYRYMRKNIEAEACWKHILTLKKPQKFGSIDKGIYGELTAQNLAIIAAERKTK